ncbi:17-beta-hydroxysteroid dehydrogenase type 2-like [Protopterus annectens]|uniref:17-beta-hydroxysteroid dehydrogenase type 2-like n=1 Tax=Protopterus annectens TaxID=7888 RepID=UPI001CFAD2E6|nr:17-beta-hydroxysteroid dehydrogenase type 2-like [Protopterus annectens]
MFNFYLLAYTVVIFCLGCLLFLYSLRYNTLLSAVGKAVLITGCDSGFGHALAKHLHSQGFLVFAAVLDEDGNGAQELKSYSSGRLRVFQMDVTKREQVQDAQRNIECHLENNDFWAVVNNAGVIINVGEAELLSVDVYKQCMDVNFLGAVAVTKMFLPMLRRSKGRVVNVSSLLGAVPISRISAYASSKAALEMFSDILRQEMKPWGVKVSIIQPTAYKTGQICNFMYWEQQNQSAINTLPVEVLEDYGEAFIRENKNKFLQSVSTFCNDLSPVIKAITMALLSKYPKGRYSAGPWISCIKAVSYLLPSSVTDSIFSSVFLPHDQIPNALKNAIQKK